MCPAVDWIVAAIVSFEGRARFNLASHLGKK
jgi:hypothetical protein